MTQLRRLQERLVRALATERALGYLVLTAILALLAVDKLVFTSHSYATGVDGGYYTEVAKHVRDGEGLVTNVSLLHKGYPSFPHPTSIYPLWPLLYGYTARLFPLLDTGKWLATAGYFAALLFGYAWAQAIFPRSLFPRTFPGFGAGHVFVLVLGFAHGFYQCTTLPYTEGLTYTLVMVALWRSTTLLQKPSWKSGLELGVWIGLAPLARMQLLLLPMAAVPVLAAAVLLMKGSRKQYAVMAGCCAVAFVAVLAPHYVYLASFIENFSLGDMLRFDQVRFCPELSEIDVFRKTEGLWDFIVDRARGLPVAFELSGKQGYHAQFRTFHYALPFTVLLLLLSALRRWTRTDLRAAWQWLCRPTSLKYLFIVVFALGAFLSIHSMHKSFGVEWLFMRRHALVCVFIFYLALIYLLARAPTPGRLLGVLLLCSGVWLGWRAHQAQAAKVSSKKPPRAYNPALVDWLHQERDARGKLTVVVRQPQPIAPHTTGVGYRYHWNRTTYRDIETMVTRLDTDYVLVAGRKSHTFMRSRAWRNNFELLGKRGGFRVYQPSEQLRARRQPCSPRR